MHSRKWITARLPKLAVAVAVSWFALHAPSARAAILIENSSGAAVRCRIREGERAAQVVAIAAGATQSLDAPRAVECAFATGNQQLRYTLRPEGRYRFLTSAGGVLELRSMPATPAAGAPPARAAPAQSAARARVEHDQPPARPPGGWADVREVRVIVAGGKEYRAFYRDKWTARAGQIVEAASRRFEDQFPIRFRVVGYRPWEYRRAPQTAGDAFEWLHKIDRGDADLVIGFTMVPFPGPRGEIRGVSQYFSQYVVIPDCWGMTGATTRLVHELGHVFGAFHVADLDSVMQLGFERTPKKFRFGAPTEQTIELAKNVDLNEGVDSLPPETQEKIREIYRANHHPLERADEDPIVAGYRYQARRATWAGDKERSARMQAAADRLQPPDEAPAPAADEADAEHTPADAPNAHAPVE